MFVASGPLSFFYIKQLKNNWFDIKQLTAIDDLFHDSTTQRTIRVGVTRALAFHFPLIRDARRVSLLGMLTDIRISG